LRVIPVIDILNGVTVHAARGKRKEYQPIESILCDSAEPLRVASAFEALGFAELYIADLDNIMGKGSSFPIVKQIAEKTKLKIMVDAGIYDVEKAREAFRSKALKIVVGTETLQNLGFVREAADLFGNEHVVVSLDLLNGKIMSKSEIIESIGALALARRFQEMGVTEIVVLDLARVGSGEGADVPLLKDILNSVSIRVLVGGGVRNLKELKMLEGVGVCGTLLATALHSGRISVEDLRSANMI